MSTDHRYNGVCKCGQAISTVLSAPEGQARASHWVNCPACGKRPRLVKVKGVYNPDHPCDARCTSAKGSECSCSCGGANHGKDHGVNNTVVAQVISVYKKPVADRAYIGEVGKHIKGEVTVEKVLHNVGKYANTLVTFATKGGDVIKWWAPARTQPEAWVEGYSFTLRAKVKRHDDGDYGKETIVTYCEEWQDPQQQLPLSDFEREHGYPDPGPTAEEERKAEENRIERERDEAENGPVWG
jgi:hypothetical protein